MIGNEYARDPERLPSCGYFTGRTVPARCRGILSRLMHLAIALHAKHYPEVIQWEPLRGDMSGLIGQIDNMTSGMCRAAERDALLVQRDALAAALRGFMDIVSESHGVAGYHLNGDVAGWDEFDQINAADAALSTIAEDSNG